MAKAIPFLIAAILIASCGADEMDDSIRTPYGQGVLANFRGMLGQRKAIPSIDLLAGQDFVSHSIIDVATVDRNSALVMLNISVHRPEYSAGGFDYRNGDLVGTLEFSTMNGSSRIEFDLENGLSFPVSGSAIRLWVENRSVRNHPEETEPPIVTAFIGVYGARGGVVKRSYRRSLPPGGDVTVQIPAYAEAFKVYRCNFLDAFTILVQRASQSPPAPLFVYHVPANEYPPNDWIDLPNNASEINLSYAGAAVDADLSIVFRLAL